MTVTRTTVVVTFRERLTPTVTSLQDLLDRTHVEHDLVVVDNASPPALRDRLRALADEHGFTLLRNEEQESHHASRNRALAEIDDGHVVFVDNDLRFSEGWLGLLLDCLDATGAWLVGPLYLDEADGRRRVHMAGGRIGRADPADPTTYREEHDLQFVPWDEAKDDPLVAEPRRTELVEGHCMLVNREAMDALGGGLDDRVELFAGQDLCLSVAALGGEIWIEPRAQVVYTLPVGMARMDRRFFARRWCEAWAQASWDAFVQKHDLPVEGPGSPGGLHFVRSHRLHHLVGSPRLDRLVGYRWRRRIERHLVHRLSGLERRRNLRRWPA